MTTDFDLAVARPCSKMAVGALASDLGVGGRYIDVANYFEDRNRAVARSCTNRSIQAFEANLSVRGAESDARVARHSEFEMGQAMA